MLDKIGVWFVVSGGRQKGMRIQRYVVMLESRQFHKSVSLSVKESVFYYNSMPTKVEDF